MPPDYALILLVLVAHHTGEGGCYPTLITIADHANVSVATIKRRLSALAEGGWISRTTAGREGTRRTVYTLYLDQFIEAPREKRVSGVVEGPKT